MKDGIVIEIAKIAVSDIDKKITALKGGINELQKIIYADKQELEKLENRRSMILSAIEKS